jgi:hypothetical protein
MQEEGQEIRLVAKLKAQILKQIFKDLGPKNLKSVEFFYLIVRAESMEMQFISNAKDILITIMLKRSLFQNYLYNRELPSLHKYALDDFTGLGFLFENNKLFLDLDLTYDHFKVRSVSGKGFVEFVGTPMNCDQDDEDCLIQEE